MKRIPGQIFNFELSDSNLAVCAALTFEKLIARGIIGERFLMMLHGINLACLLVVPVVVINKKHEFIGPGEIKKDGFCKTHCI